jgi:hypothetical protein
MIAEIGAGASKDLPFRANDQASTAGVIEKGEAVGSSIVIDAVLRHRRDFSLAHERLHQLFVDAESSCDEVGIYNDGMIFDVYFGHLIISGNALQLDETDRPLGKSRDSNHPDHGQYQPADQHWQQAARRVVRGDARLSLIASIPLHGLPALSPTMTVF